MTDVQEERPKGLAQGRWLGDFDPPPSEAEWQLIHACARGERCTLDQNRPAADGGTAGNTVRAGLIRFLALGGDDEHTVHEHGVKLTGAWIAGDLDLEGCDVRGNLMLHACHFERVVIARDAGLAGLFLDACHCPGLEADRIRARGGVHLRNGFAATGEVRLLGATIGGSLDCSGGIFTNAGDDALSIDGATIVGSVFLNKRFSASGSVRLLVTTIGGNLACGDGTFVRQDGWALIADGAKVAGSVSCNKGFSATGEVSLLGIAIGRNLACTGGTFANPGGDALSVDGGKVAGDVFLSGGFSANGAVRLPGAAIGGDLTCAGGHFAHAAGKAIRADGASIGGNAYLNQGFSTVGEVSLLDVVIGGTLDCAGGTLDNADGDALSADRTKVAGTVFLNLGFSAKGQVRLPGAAIGGNLSCNGAMIQVPPGLTALNLQGAVISGALILRTPPDRVIAGSIDLIAARVATLIDSSANDGDGAPACWRHGRHFLDGFTYTRIIGSTNARTRIAWLETQHDSQLNCEDWAPQPWEQLIRTLREMGHPHEAAKVAIAKQWRMWRAGKIGTWWWRRKPVPIPSPLGWMQNLWHVVTWLLTGFGYRPWQAVIGMVLVGAACGHVYREGYDQGYFAPANAGIVLHAHDLCGAPGDLRPGRRPLAKLRWNDPACTPPEYTGFQPWLYSLDLILPVVSLGQRGDWSPIVSDAAGHDLPTGSWLRRLVWAEILFGWVATLQLAAILGNLVKKD
jgi:hypothetical protein